MGLQIVPSESGQAVEHEAVCSIDGESWPCLHHRKLAHFALTQRYDVRCLACGQLRNYWASLNIEKGLDGRAVYFHDRKRCTPKAERWWRENVQPITGESFVKGQGIADLSRYMGVRCQLEAVTAAASDPTPSAKTAAGEE